MKTKFLRMYLVLLTLICLHFSVTAQTNEELKAKITKINREMAQAMIEGNTQKNLSFYTDDAISMPDNEKMSEGIAAIKQSNEKMAASGVRVKSFDTNTIYAVPCDNMVVEVGSFKISFSVPGATDAMEEAGKYVTIWEKQADGSLKIKLETWNSDTSPAANQQ